MPHLKLGSFLDEPCSLASFRLTETRLFGHNCIISQLIHLHLILVTGNCDRKRGSLTHLTFHLNRAFKGLSHNVVDNIES